MRGWEIGSLVSIICSGERGGGGGGRRRRRRRRRMVRLAPKAIWRIHRRRQEHHKIKKWVVHVHLNTPINITFTMDSNVPYWRIVSMFTCLSVTYFPEWNMAGTDMNMAGTWCIAELRKERGRFSVTYPWHVSTVHLSLANSIGRWRRWQTPRSLTSSQTYRSWYRSTDRQNKGCYSDEAFFETCTWYLFSEVLTLNIFYLT